MEYNVWRDLGIKMLNEDYKKYYFTPEKVALDNPLASLVVLPGFEDFYGPRVLNLFIVAKPYGWKKEAGKWVDRWPPEGLEDAVERHKATFEKFTSYRTIIFMDDNFVDRLMERSPKSKIREMMSAVGSHLEELCGDLGDYGFEFGPRIDTEVGVEFFASYLDKIFQIETR